MNTIVSKLFAHTDANVYGVVDGVSLKVNTPLFLEELDLDFTCLLRGELEPDLAARAPYLIKLTRGSEFLNLWLDEGWGKHWGIFAVSYADMKIMRRFFRKFLKVRNTNGKLIYFRFYDPRVFGTFLEACDADEKEFFFGPVLEYLAELNQAPVPGGKIPREEHFKSFKNPEQGKVPAYRVFQLTDKHKLAFAKPMEQNFIDRTATWLQHSFPDWAAATSSEERRHYIKKMIDFAAKHEIYREDNIQRLLDCHRQHQFSLLSLGDFESRRLTETGLDETNRVAAFSDLVSSGQGQLQLIDLTTKITSKGH